MKRALITGITGQDGSYLTELLLEKGYEVHGLVRRASTPTLGRISHLAPLVEQPDSRLILHHGDLADGNSLMQITLASEPDEIYNLAAQSHVQISFENPVYSADVAGMGALRVLEAARQLARRKPVRVYQASTSEMYGKVRAVPQTETTPFYPRSPYACAKVFAFHQTVNYREAYDLFACNGILFNHESERRGENFVTRKITLAAARIAEGLQDRLFLGNLNARRDWGYAPDYVQAMWMMLQHNQPDDYVVATGTQYSVEDFARTAFAHVGLDWKNYVDTDERFVRPSETDELVGDPTKAKNQLGWVAATHYEGLVKRMIEHDLALARQEKRGRA